MSFSPIKNYDFYLFNYADGLDLDVDPEFKKVTVSANDLTTHSNVLTQRHVVYLSHKQREELPVAIKSNQAFMDFLRACSLMVNIDYLPAEVLNEIESEEIKPGLAITLLTQSAHAGNALAQLNLSILYQTNKGVTPDDAISLVYLKHAANQNVASAQYRLGKRYYSGQGVRKDLSEAVRLYRLASNAGLLIAQLDLGCCYANGEGIRKNQFEAYALIYNAYLQGLPEAIPMVAHLYAYGIGVPADATKAGMFYRLANLEPEETHLMTFLDHHFITQSALTTRSGTGMNVKNSFKRSSRSRTSAPKRKK